MLCIGTSTQFQLSFLNINTINDQVESNHAQEPVAHTLLISQNSDGSIVVRAVDSVSHTRKPSSLRSNI
jgi:hypothetical protein